MKNMSDYQKKLADAPYHPGYEDAVVTPTPKYTGMNPDKMLWKTKPLTHGEILNMYLDFTNGNKDLDVFEFAKAIEERHGIK
jgi:hypothetical protein